MNHGMADSWAEFWAAGGFPMFAVLIFGIITIVAAALFARRPESAKVGAIVSLSIVELLTVAMGVVTDLGTVGHEVPKMVMAGKLTDPLQLILLQGFAESMTPATLGFALLSVVWILMAVGYRRMRRVTPAAS